MAVTVVVFDLDGVIVDSEPTHERATILFMEQVGAPYEREFFRSYIGRRNVDLAHGLGARLGMDPDEVLARRDEIFDRLVASDGLAPRPGLIEALESARSAGTSLAVASSGTRKHIISVLTATGTAEYFSHVVSGDDVTHSKPHPEIYLLAAERLGCPAAGCAAIEDAPNGVLSAKAAGMFVIAVPNDHTRDLDLSAADRIEKNLVMAMNAALNGYGDGR